MRTSTRRVFLLAVIAVAFNVTAAPSADGSISEFALSTEGHRPQAVVVGPDGTVYVTEVIKHKILRISPEGAITEFPVPGEKVGVLQGIAIGADGNLYFTSREENAIRRMSPKGEFNGTFELPSKAVKPDKFNQGAWPRAIAAGPDGNLWFSELAANKIGRITTKGEITEFPVPTPESGPYGIAFDKAGMVWFTESQGDKVGRLDPKTGKINEFKLAAPKSLPRDMTTAPDGNLWFSENLADKIGRVTPAGEVKEFAVPTGSRPVGVAASADGSIWFAAFGTGKIGRMTPEGKVTMLDIPTPKAQPFGMAAAPDGDVWFAEQANRIGRVNVKSADGQ